MTLDISYDSPTPSYLSRIALAADVFLAAFRQLASATVRINADPTDASAPLHRSSLEAVRSAARELAASSGKGGPPSPFAVARDGQLIVRCTCPHCDDAITAVVELSHLYDATI